MNTVGQYLKSKGRSYPVADLPNGNISEKAFAEAKLPMVVCCTRCETSMACTENLACDDDGQIWCDDCNPDAY